MRDETATELRRLTKELERVNGTLKDILKAIRDKEKDDGRTD